MLNKTQLKILSYLIDNPGKYFGIRELARSISSLYYLVQRNIKYLIKEKIIYTENAGKTNLIFLHPQIEKTHLIEAEQFKRNNFYAQYPHIKLVLKKIVKDAKISFFILMVFGSYAKGQARKDSDLDLLVIVPQQKQVELMEIVIASIARLSTVQLHETVVSEKSFKSMLEKKELNVANEAKEKHILIYGLENYYKLIN